MTAMRKTSLIIAGSLVLATAGQSFAVSVTFRQGGGTGYVGVPWDAVSINPGAGNPANSTQYHLRASGSPADRGYYLLMGIKGLVTELLLSSSEINTATLTIVGDWGDFDTCALFRVTSDWLTSPAGQNETNTTEQYRDKDAFLTWASGDYSVSDYDDAVYRTYTWTYAYGVDTDFDVTDMVKSMCDAGNSYGWCLTNFATDDENIIPYNPATGGTNTGELMIDYTKAGNFALTVNSGTGDGSYAAGDIIHISADPAPSGKWFAGWSGDSAWIYEPTMAETMMTMPPRAASIVPVYVVPEPAALSLLALGSIMLIRRRRK